MFEDKHIFKFICALLGFASIIIPGPIVPIISFVIAISMLVYKIKCAKESQQGFELLMIDIVLIIIVLVIDIGLFAMRISIENEYNYSSSSSQEMTISDFAEATILGYKAGNLSQFSDKGNHQSAIKSGFTTYLKDELGIKNVSINENKITCNVRENTIIFTITKNDIKYSIK